VWDAAREAIERARDGEGPSVLHVKLMRYYGHFEGDAMTYRAPGEIDKMKAEKDCLKLFRQRVTEAGLLEAPQLDQIDKRRGRSSIGAGRGQGGAEADCGRSLDRRLRLLLSGEHHVQKIVPAGDQRGAPPGDGARSPGDHHGRGHRRRQAPGEDALGPAGRHQNLAEFGPTACSSPITESGSSAAVGAAATGLGPSSS
jgi:hypothetical protein